jgi:hypothetical protein
MSTVTPPALNTRSQAKECKTCDFCQIKKELSKLNQMIICPTKANLKKLFDETNVDGKKRKRSTAEEGLTLVEDAIDIMKNKDLESIQQLAQDIVNDIE